MRYQELEELQKNWNGKVCLFGAGLIGCTWAYDLLKEAGFYIDFYCDNKKKENIVIRDDVRTISLDTLYSLNDNVLVFITVTDRYQDSIRRQLETNGVHHIVKADFLFLQTFIESLIEMNNSEVNERFSCILDDAEYISRQFQYRMREKIDFSNPQTFNEKLQWLKLHDRNAEYVKMVDKYSVKEYVADKIGEEYIIPTLGIYDTFDEIDFDKLPQQFVLKCTHDSGSIVICKDKDNFNREEARNIIESSLRRNFFWVYREWPYKNVQPRIIAEKYMVDESGYELKDYKFFCFDGRARIMYIVSDRMKGEEAKSNFFDMEFHSLAFENGHPNADYKIEKPDGFETMKSLADRLCVDIPHVRIDFYNINGKIYFGEITFFSWSGYMPFNPSEWDKKLGELIPLEKVII